MTGAVWQQKVARFRVVPYFARKKIDLPDGILSIIDVSQQDLEKIEAQPDEEVELSRDYLMDGVFIDNLTEETEEFENQEESI